MRKQFNKVEGLKGEFDACEYLKGEKYWILAKNYKNKLGEIDIIAKQGKTIVFVEVKARSTLAFGRPSEAVNVTKQRKIRNVAQIYLMEQKLLGSQCRFDIIEVIGGDEINHIENAF